jgi:thiamine biosynthesis lipoprotein
MGTTNELVVHGGDEAVLDLGVALVERCERRWSRFRASSELTRLNASAGRPVVLERDTFDLVVAAVSCWYLTGGRFDPTVEPAMRAAGYDRTFEEASLEQGDPVPAPGCGDIELDGGIAAVTLPAGVTLDLGGIAKGHTADLVAAAVLDAGADGVAVNLGGDVRVAGEPDGDEWHVGVEDPFAPGTLLTTIRLASGAVATSSVLRRRWRGTAGPAHHLIDPVTGAPAISDLASVTVAAATAAWAEVHAKAALLAGSAAADVVRAARVTGLGVSVDGTWSAFDGLEAFV